MSLAALELFNEKAARLRDSALTRSLIEDGASVRMKAEPETGRVEITEVLPDQDAIDAFVLTVRFFCQNNETTSLRNLGRWYERSPLPEDVKARVRESRKVFNDYLDSTGEIAINFDGRAHTRRHIFEVFVYGGIAHANHREEYEFWRGDQILFPYLRMTFVDVLQQYIRITQWFAALNLEAMEHLRVVGGDTQDEASPPL